MARAELVFLNEREEDLIHEQSIKTLERIGVNVHSRSVLQLLEEKGARVDYDTMIAELPEAPPPCPPTTSSAEFPVKMQFVAVLPLIPPPPRKRPSSCN